MRPTQINPTVFAAVCFLVLMDNGKGIFEKYPDYIKEKHMMLDEGFAAFKYLDILNKIKVVRWVRKFGGELPPAVLEEFEAEAKAAGSLIAKGFPVV